MKNLLIYADLKIIHLPKLQYQFVIHLIKKSVKTVENYYQKVLTGIIKLAIIPSLTLFTI